MNAEQYEIRNYDDFVAVLLKTGFSMAGGNREGIFSAVPWNWQEEPPYDTPVRWHTGEPETDPWEWRLRVLAERKDIAYAKLFFNKGGFITKEWYPYFLAARRQNRLFEEAYAEGTISNQAKRIYETITEHGPLPVHGIKALAGFSREDKSRFDRALIELQMKMYITMCGGQQKLSTKGEEYGWSATVLCLTEDFFGEEVFEQAEDMSRDAAVEAIAAQVYRLNPDAQAKRIMRFIGG